jgi:hypothetical protein
MSGGIGDLVDRLSRPNRRVFSLPKSTAPARGRAEAALHKDVPEAAPHDPNVAPQSADPRTSYDSTCLFTQLAAFWINPFGCASFAFQVAANRHFAGFPTATLCTPGEGGYLTNAFAARPGRPCAATLRQQVQFPDGATACPASEEARASVARASQGYPGQAPGREIWMMGRRNERGQSPPPVLLADCLEGPHQ